GTVFDGGGRHATGGMVMAMTAGNAAMMNVGAVRPLAGDGTFTLTGLSPGEYTLNVRASFDENRDGNPLKGLENAGFSLPIALAGTDVTDLRVTVPEPIVLQGRVVVESGVLGEKDQVNVNLMSAASFMDGATAQAGADGRFTLKVVPGVRRLSAWAPKGFVVKRTTWRGRDVEADDDVEITTEGGRIDVVVTNRLSVVTGAVTDGSGKPVTDYQVIIFPEDAELARRAGMRRLRFERGDQQGRFRAEGLPPGRYLAAAVADLDPDEASDPDALEAYRRIATPVRLTEGQTETMNLTLAAMP
ncbi:MAG: hypothetical protein ABIT71_02610, partial [Vicinamibacteraceae bacterium]